MHISNKCSIAVHCLLCIHEFGKDIRVTSEMLAMSSGVNPVTIRGIMSALKKDSIISVKPGTGGAVLCCPPEEISMYRICSAVEPDFLEKLFGIHQSPSQLCPVGKIIGSVLKVSYDEIAENLTKSLKSITMEEIIRNYKDASGENNLSVQDVWKCYLSASGSSGVT